MSDPIATPRSALGGASFDGLVSIREYGPQGMITLRADLSDKTVAAAVKKATGLGMPAQRGTITKDDKAALWMSPDELMVLCAYEDVAKVLAALKQALGAVHALAVDVSDARAVFSLKGDGLRDVLAKITPADMRASALPVGELRRTRLAQVAGAFWFVGEEHVELICFRSVADYVFTLLSTAAAPGTELAHHN
ncbi:sarcosine oxidase subunit gamma [Roseobacteraceae bacterium S113]